MKQNGYDWMTEDGMSLGQGKVGWDSMRKELLKEINTVVNNF